MLMFSQGASRKASRPRLSVGNNDDTHANEAQMLSVGRSSNPINNNQNLQRTKGRDVFDRLTTSLVASRKLNAKVKFLATSIAL
jgi:hypothetical protein